MAARLKDKVILVTGAAGAVGAAVVHAIREQGGTPIAADIRPNPGIDIRLDVTAEADWIAAMDAVEQSAGRLEGLVNAAGVAAIGTIEDTSFEDWRRVMAVNLDGTFLGCKHAMQLLKRDGGAIVNLSSVAGLVGGHNFVAYNASKGGVRLLTKSVALHGARLDPKVRCNSIHPAFLDGPMVDDILQDMEFPAGARARLTRDIPLGRFGTAEEVAGMAVYLLSDESCFVTGAEFVIDGGMTAR